MIIQNHEFFKKIDNPHFWLKENEKFFCIWKDHWIPSSFGEEKSFLDMIEDETLEEKEFIKNQKENFTKEEEFGLLNRLDNDTAGFLYFAKTKEAQKQYRKKQKNDQINKKYIAIIKWNFPFDTMDISHDIMHKGKSKMIAIVRKTDKKKWRWKLLTSFTNIRKINFDQQEQVTYLEIWIRKWVRHQIRVHLASISREILWDSIYWENKLNETLWLYSLGFSMQNS